MNADACCIALSIAALREVAVVASFARTLSGTVTVGRWGSGVAVGCIPAAGDETGVGETVCGDGWITGVATGTAGFVCESVTTAPKINVVIAMADFRTVIRKFAAVSPSI